jgi:hypothetical protein
MKKISKKLPNTVHDPLWAHPNVPEYIRNTLVEYEDGVVKISSLGFPGPNNMRQCSPALQRQISILTADKEADYYLFDDADEPVRVTLGDPLTRTQFRHMRTTAWSDDSDNLIVVAMAQYLVKYWGKAPGLSREMILKQFDAEYGEGTAAKIEDFEREGVETGHGGETYVEVETNKIRSVPTLSQFRRPETWFSRVFLD